MHVGCKQVKQRGIIRRKLDYSSLSRLLTSTWLGLAFLVLPVSGPEPLTKLQNIIQYLGLQSVLIRWEILPFLIFVLPTRGF